MRKVEILIGIVCYRRWLEQNEQPGRGQGLGSPMQLLQVKWPSKLMLWGSQLVGWPRPDREPPDITVPHSWGQTLEGSHGEGGLGLLTSWKLGTTKSTLGY